ncbi:MAG: carbon starvation protein A, partial [Planctomycetota bacterium]
AWMTFIPMIFMFVTTLTASYQLFIIFLDKSASATMTGDSFTFTLDAILVAAMAILAIITLLDSIYKWYGWLKRKRNA